MSVLTIEEKILDASEPELFMKAKDFAVHVGVSYGLVRDWIKQGIPVEPDYRSPYYIFVPAALAWLKKKYQTQR